MMLKKPTQATIFGFTFEWHNSLKLTFHVISFSGLTMIVMLFNMIC